MLLCNKYSTVYTIAIYQVSNVMPMYIVLLVQHCLPHLVMRTLSRIIGKITSWMPNTTPIWMMITVIEGMFLTSTLTVADHQQLLIALGSLSSSVEQYMSHSANCVKCKKNKRQDLIELLADSGTSLNFTHEWSDLSEFQEVHNDDFASVCR